jgi:hypothetical protein
VSLQFANDITAIIHRPVLRMCHLFRLLPIKYTNALASQNVPSIGHVAAGALVRLSKLDHRPMPRQYRER